MPCLRIFEANPAPMPGMVLVLAEYRQVCRLSADSARARLFGYAGISCGLCGGGGGNNSLFSLLLFRFFCFLSILSSILSIWFPT